MLHITHLSSRRFFRPPWAWNLFLPKNPPKYNPQRLEMERPTNWRDIRSAALDCKQLFEACLEQIAEPRTASLLGKFARISCWRATDQMHRVYAWLYGMDVEAEEGLSLDHCLSNNKGVRDEVINRLRELFHSLQYVIQIARIKDDENRDVRGNYNPDNLATDLLNAQRSLEKNIAELYKLGETIQKPPSITGLLDTVRALVAKQQLNFGMGGIPHGILQHLYPTTPFNLRRLLAKSIQQRYFDIKGRGERQRATRRLLASKNGQMEIRDDGPELRESITRKDQDDDTSTSTADGFTAQTSGTNPPTLQVDEFRRRLGAEWQHVALSTTSSVAVGDISYPQPPRLLGNGESSQATCHCCYESYPHSEFQDAAWWRRHVDHDLRPYVCLMRKCTADHKSFGEFKLWFEHMEDYHSSSWIAILNGELKSLCDIDTIQNYSRCLKSSNTLAEKEFAYLDPTTFALFAEFTLATFSRSLASQVICDILGKHKGKEI
ncbi:uncharacterized protein Triagg1_5173 [Trichoderma aggressivum f. europaeum]|uniref:Uncharacterized protein n=1 Tax=Trichoderma aggressivum f. europaeum TaxID=173218 RepID=A0AAE1IDS9_9HYPO|nr:hypothetical protein Triagg1_5173 [Trichoderma aggressivum f. europaeum]